MKLNTFTKHFYLAEEMTTEWSLECSILVKCVATLFSNVSMMSTSCLYWKTEEKKTVTLFIILGGDNFHVTSPYEIKHYPASGRWEYTNFSATGYNLNTTLHYLRWEARKCTEALGRITKSVKFRRCLIQSYDSTKWHHTRLPLCIQLCKLNQRLTGISNVSIDELLDADKGFSSTIILHL